MTQSQQSLLDQLNLVIDLANKNGYYDAADWIKSILENQKKKA